jgi:hypothetical protein
MYPNLGYIIGLFRRKSYLGTYEVSHATAAFVAFAAFDVDLVHGSIGKVF